MGSQSAVIVWSRRTRNPTGKRHRSRHENATVGPRAEQRLYSAPDSRLIRGRVAESLSGRSYTERRRRKGRRGGEGEEVKKR